MNGRAIADGVRRRFAPPSRATGHIISIAVLGTLMTGCLALSWRRWTTLEFDFGRELYVPWRLANGAVLYREVEDFYGPLSQYFNATLFWVFGPGIMVLAVANLAIFVAILGSLHVLLSKAWNGAGALVGSTIFLTVFGFAHYTRSSNFNYATPYAHEATHGMLLLLALVATLAGWLRHPSVARTLLAGLLLGASLLLKSEIFVTAALLTAVTLGLQRRDGGRISGGQVALWCTATIAPTALCALYFLRHAPFVDALAYAGRGWLNVIGTTRFVRDPVQIGYLGLDAPGPNLFAHLSATMLGVVGLVAVVFGGRLAARLQSSTSRFLAGIAIVGTVAIISVMTPATTWLNVGRSFFGLLLCYLGVTWWRHFRRGARPDSSETTSVRILLAVLATALMFRMILNGRIYQFGFYQAAIAGAVIPTVVVCELPDWFCAPRAARGVIIACVLAVVVPGVSILSAVSYRNYRAMTVPIGTGRDRVFVEEPTDFGSGVLIDFVAHALRQSPPGQSLLVLPEGQALNYLAGMKSPLSPFFFYSASTADGRELALVQELERNPPEWVAILARDLREYGIQRYGETVGHGKLLIDWTLANYSSRGKIGSDPLGNGSAAIALFHRKSPAIDQQGTPTSLPSTK